MSETAKKPGIKTTEFWVGILTAPLIAIIAAVLSAVGVEVSDATVATMVAPAIAYIVGRGWVKKEAIKADSGIE